MKRLETELSTPITDRIANRLNESTEDLLQRAYLHIRTLEEKINTLDTSDQSCSDFFDWASDATTLIQEIVSAYDHHGRPDGALVMRCRTILDLWDTLMANQASRHG